MACNNGLFGGSACSWIVILIILSMCCGDGNGLFGTNNSNSCGCNNCGCNDSCC